VRIGVDNHDSYEFFRDFVGGLRDAGCERVIVHARKALLDGVTSTRQNRIDELVPIRYDRAFRLKRDFPDLPVELNGALGTMDDVAHALRPAEDGVRLDGAMLGRAARDTPWTMAEVDGRIFGDADVFAGLSPLEARLAVVEQYAAYCDEEMRSGRERSREMLLKPTNQIMEGLPGPKRRFAALLRSAPAALRPPLFGDELRAASETLRRDHRRSPTGLRRGSAAASRRRDGPRRRARGEVPGGPRALERRVEARPDRTLPIAPVRDPERNRSTTGGAPQPRGGHVSSDGPASSRARAPRRRRRQHA
jgi:hypothetical protein